MPILPRKVESAVPLEAKTASNVKPSVNAEGCKHCHNEKHGDHFGKKILMTLFGVLLVYLTFYVGALMRNSAMQYNFIGKADQAERTITVNGFAKVNAKNDLAMTTVGFSNTDSDVAKAQADNKKVMDAVMADLKKLGIEDKDLRSDYSINPQYDYTDKGQVFKGYQVVNNVTIKIRDLSKITSILGLPGKDGANQVGGLTFTIDDTENLKTLAREKALVDAKRRAAQLSQSLGTVLGEVVAYTDYETQTEAAYYGRGGGMVMDAVAPATISGGSADVGMNVSVTYKIYSGSY
jgi:hypothetical protein